MDENRRVVKCCVPLPGGQPARCVTCPARVNIDDRPVLLVAAVAATAEPSRCCLQGLSRAQQRGFAAEKAVAAEVDWDAINAMVHSDEGKRELASLRSSFLDIQARLSGMAKDSQPPNWGEWKKELDPKIVDGFKAAYESE